ncbi:MAG: FxsA family protein [Dehalogenimonas sp.]|uniref:FxsA family protein n=1 Tax=Candidatus Dehalogenimonas loeffleri TaxID=3127115 RepID=A0ABZ2J501_9CHLR|nr:FxsA family protein [Dehalogenimonas sp.]
MPLGLLFVGIPLIELALLIYIGNYLGVFNTVLLVIVTGLVGAALARSQGFTALSKIRNNMAQGTPPGDDILQGGLILIGGLLLLTPGVLTDLIGFALLIPPFRIRAAAALKAFIMNKIRRGDVRYHRIQ